MSLLAACLGGVALYLIVRLLYAKSQLPLPPGPPGWPIIKNLFDVPSHGAWLAYAELGRKYGEISSMNVLGTRMIILNSEKAVSDILDKNSAISSDRPHFVMANDLCGWKDVSVFVQTGEQLRQVRKMFHRELGNKVKLASFYHVQEEETRRFLYKLLKSPEGLADHIRKMMGAIILKISHGYSVREGVDPFVDLADRVMANFAMIAVPGAYLVDIIPALRHLPEWFPGTGFLQDAKRYREQLFQSATRPHQFVLDEMAKGTHFPSFTSKLLEGGVTQEEEYNIKWASLTMYLGGSDTIVSTTYGFFLAMTIYSNVQKKAQAELDAVVGTNRLPTFNDRESLPYINAICKEVFRWCVVVPTGIAHVMTQDSSYGGYFIPKGSYIIPNAWAILHDERIYPDPGTFNPERFLGENPQPDPLNHCFGYGRRICPGMYLAEGSLFITVAMCLAAFNISKCVENGVEIIPKLELSDGAVSRPQTFKCNITSRSAKVEDLISVA